MSAPTAAPPPYPEGDPRNGKYFENLAALEHQRENALGGDAEARTSARSAYDYNTGVLDRQLPLTLQGTRNTANSQGLLESGQLAQRTGTVESQYAARRGRLTAGLQQTEGRINRDESNTNDNFYLGRSRAATNAREEGKAELERQAPNEQAPAAPASRPPAPAAPVAVRSHVQKVTSSPRARTIRRQAVKRAVH